MRPWVHPSLSSRSNACIRAQFGVEETVVGMMYSEWWYTQFHDALKTPPEQAQPVIEQNGYLFLYEDPEQAGAPWQSDLRHAARTAWDRALAQVAMQRRKCRSKFSRQRRSAHAGRTSSQTG